jgi:hypothetical protein
MLKIPTSLIDLGQLLVIQNHKNANICKKGQCEAQHKKYKRLKPCAEFTYKLDRPQHWALQSEITNTEKKNGHKTMHFPVTVGR